MQSDFPAVVLERFQHHGKGGTEVVPFQRIEGERPNGGIGVPHRLLDGPPSRCR